jgi:UDP-GlcNAc:undecaprenyl-phosphate GlcNAc-1-phosphate transferase
LSFINSDSCMTLFEMDVLWTGASAFLLAMVGVLLSTPLVMRAARAMDWVAYPRADRWHGRPTALMGGIAIYAAATLGLLLVVPVHDVWLIWAGASLMFVVGAVDDLAQIQPAAKLAAQVVATGLLLYAGYAFGGHWPLWLSLPLTLLWVIGITNAVNLLDNMDGLSAGVAGIAALVMTVFAAVTGSATTVVLGSAVGGAALGFLAFNFKPARIFMGDCGSLFLGFSISALALIVQQQADVAGQLSVALIPLSVLAVPILDTTLVTLMRKLAGRPVSQGGRDHASHRLVFLGLSEKHAVLMLYGLSLCSGALALAVLFVDVKLFYALSVFVGAALGVFGVHLARANVYQQGGTSGDGAPASPVRPLEGLHNVFGHHWKAAAGILTDVFLVGAAFVVAHYLRFEGGLGPAHEERMLEVLPLVVALKVLIFYGMGLYRGIWRHAGTPELMRTVSTTVLAGSAVFGVYAVLYGSEMVSVSVLVIDWMIVTIAVVGVRFGFRGLRQYLAANRKQGRRVLLYGAGDAGVLTLRELRRNPDLGRTPVGFIDDDAMKQGQTVQGLQVLGTGEDLVDVCRRQNVDEVIVTTATMPEARQRAVYRRCQEADIPCAAFDVTVEPLRPDPSVVVTDEAEISAR